MKPAYMPFTYASEQMIKRLYAVFGRFAMLAPVSGNEPAPVRQELGTGRLELRIPVSGREQQILETVANCSSWGQAHEGHMDAARAFGGEDFSSEKFSAEIRSDILRGGSREEPADPEATARVFLALAQDFDRQQAELETELLASQKRQKKLFADLKDDNDTRLPLTEQYTPEDPGAYQTRHRILSWLRLAAADEEPPRVWITSSPAVFSHIREFLPESRLVCESLPVAAEEKEGEALASLLADLSASAAQDLSGLQQPRGGEKAVLTAAVLPFSSPAALLGKLLSQSPEAEAEPGQQQERIVLALALI
ncbi:MAG: hypothetical protein R6X08_07550 [Desulfosalsimonadaceae bacterium]